MGECGELSLAVRQVTLAAQRYRLGAATARAAQPLSSTELAAIGVPV